MSDKQRVSAWLNELQSHGIYDAEQLFADFTKCTGEPVPDTVFRGYAPATARKHIEQRGLGGTFDDTATGKQVYGWELAEEMAKHYAPSFKPWQQGRGFRFGSAVSAIETAGR